MQSIYSNYNCIILQLINTCKDLTSTHMALVDVDQNPFAMQLMKSHRNMNSCVFVCQKKQEMELVIPVLSIKPGSKTGIEQFESEAMKIFLTPHFDVKYTFFHSKLSIAGKAHG